MVTTLADLIHTTPRRFSYRITVNGVPLLPANANDAGGVPGVLSFGYDDSAARIDLNRCPSWMRAGQRVTIDAGFNGLTQRVWTGSLIALPGEDPDYLRSRVLVTGADVTIGVPPDDVQSTLTAAATLVGADIQPPLPADTNIEHEISAPLVHDSDRLASMANRYLGRFGVVPRRPSGEMNKQTIICGGSLYGASRAYQLEGISVGGMTDEDAINLICEIVGIDHRVLIEPPDGWYTLDAGAIVRRGRPLDMLQQLCEIGGLQMYHTEDGVVVFRYVDFAPGPSHAWEYSTTDQDTARIIAATGELEVLWNPFVRKFSTGLLDIPFLNVNSERVFARNVRHEIGPSGERTYIDAWGGSRLGGTVEQNPIASYTFLVEREIIGDAVYLVYTCDASGSFDPDGTTVTYAWTCNRATLPVALPATKVITFRVAATVALPLSLTLTVTDADSLTHAVTLDLPTTADAVEMQIPAIFAALENNASATPDGGSNWNDQSGLSGDEVSVDAKPADGVNSGIACYGYTDGSIKRTTTFAATTPTTVKAADAADGTILVIWWDKVVTTRCWAGTSTGRLYKADDDGVTWELFKDFGTGQPIWKIATPLGPVPSVWAIGGRADVTTTLLRWSFAPAGADSGAFNSIAVGGHLATDLVGAGSGVYVRAAASRIDGELAILFNGTVPGGINLFYTADVHGDGSAWQRATGTPAGDTDGRDLVPDTDQGTFRAFFADRSVHTCTNGIAYTEATNVLPAGFTPNMVLWLGDYTGHKGTYLIAAEDAGHTGAIYKWLASEATADELRPATGFATWPASADGRAIAIGAGGTALPVQLIFLGSDYDAIAAAPIGGVAWRSIRSAAVPASPFGSFCKLMQRGPALFRVGYVGICETCSDPIGQLQRSGDGGVTWGGIGPAPVEDVDGDWWGAKSYAFATDGRLYVLYGSDVSNAANAIGIRVYRVDEPLAVAPIFTLIHSNNDLTFGTFVHVPGGISCHPHDPNILCAVYDPASGNPIFASTANATDPAPTFTNTSSDANWGDVALNIMEDGSYVFRRAGEIRRSTNKGATTSAVVATAGLSSRGVEWNTRGLTGSRTMFIGGFGSDGVDVASRIWRTKDHGATWVRIFSNTSYVFVNIYYDPIEDAVYAVTDSVSATERVFRYANASTVAADSAIAEDISGGLDALGGSWGSVNGNSCVVVR